MSRRAQRKADRTFIYSFLLTFLILAIAVVTFYYLNSLQAIQHLPPTYDFKRADWMKYVPPGAEKITIINFTQIFIKTGNESLLPGESLLVFYNFSTELKVLDVKFVATALYRNPDPNQEDLALNIVRLEQSLYLDLGKELNEKGEIDFPYGGHTIVQVTGLILNKSAPEYVKAYVAMDEGYLLYSEGIRGLNLIKQSLDSVGGPSQFFEQQQVKASLYLLLSKMGDELGFSYSTFPYAVKAVTSTSTSISYEEGLVVIRYVFAFGSTDDASKSLDGVKKANLEATDFQIVDNYIVVTTKYGSNLLLRELRAL